ncbi:hypothetical protein GLYMA_08G036702v4 [Glycine max]|nr:hypothetical protein GLYMA_08G036702v4 [Glycine max]KAH1049483.1 hypothetical protein GYH30_020148 [Glycine max]
MRLMLMYICCSSLLLQENAMPNHRSQTKIFGMLFSQTLPFPVHLETL